LSFAAFLLLLLVVTGVVWLLDKYFLRARRQGAKQPWWVEYSISFFPVILIVFVLRSFLVEPFKIPSSSMVPTLLVGDFILVNKFTYGIRLPVANRKVVQLGNPARGDVMVFRFPDDPSLDYIKRVVGLPGDHILVSDKRVYVNGDLQPVELNGPFQPMNSTPLAQIAFEQLGDVRHRVLYIDERPSVDYEGVVPDGHYFFMGDNRDNSRDSRFPEVGYVPTGNVVGKAVRIWLNWNLPNAPIWNRIGDAIH